MTNQLQEHLPEQLERELELPRIVGGGRLAGIAQERADGGHVVLVGDVEHVDDEVRAEALPERDVLGHPEVVEYGPRGNAGVSPEIAIEPEQRDMREIRGRG